MNIRFALKELLAAHNLDMRGVRGEIAELAELHRHTVERIYQNSTRTISLDVLGKLCDALVRKGVPSAELPAGLLGTSTLWDQMIRVAKTVTMYLPERTTSDSSPQSPSFTLAADDVHVSTKMIEELSRARAHAELRTLPVRFRLRTDQRENSEEDREEAQRAFYGIRNLDKAGAHVLIGSQISNLLLEIFVADLYGCTAFNPADRTKVPFYLCFGTDKAHMVQSCCAGTTAPGKQRPSKSDEGIWYRDSRGSGWSLASPDSQPGIVFVRSTSDPVMLEIALFGFRSCGTRFVGNAFLKDPQRFAPSGRESGICGESVAATLCQFRQAVGTSQEGELLNSVSLELPRLTRP